MNDAVKKKDRRNIRVFRRKGTPEYLEFGFGLLLTSPMAGG